MLTIGLKYFQRKLVINIISASLIFVLYRLVDKLLNKLTSHLNHLNCSDLSLLSIENETETHYSETNSKLCFTADLANIDNYHIDHQPIKYKILNEIETNISEFFKTDDCLVFSDAHTALFSSILIMSRNCQTVFVDDGLSCLTKMSVLKYLDNVVTFPHNNATKLGKKLVKLKRKDGNYVFKPVVFVEGIYLDLGTKCNIGEFVELKFKYDISLVVNEKFSIGCLGTHGRGIMEEETMPMSHVDLIFGDFQRFARCVGGFSAGTRDVVGQLRRLNDQYYLTSKLSRYLGQYLVHVTAHWPTEHHQDAIIQSRNTNSKFQRAFIENMSTDWMISGYDRSYVKHIQLKNGNSRERLLAIKKVLLDKAIRVDLCQKVRLDDDQAVTIELYLPAQLHENDITLFLETLKESI